MGAPSLCRLDDNGGIESHVVLEKSLVHRAGCEQRGDVGLASSDTAILEVGEDDDLRPVFDSLRGVVGDLVSWVQARGGAEGVPPRH